MTGQFDRQLIDKLAQIFHVESYDKSELDALLNTVRVKFAGTTGLLASEAFGVFVPVLGWILKGGRAAAITNAFGEALIHYFRARSPLPPMSSGTRSDCGGRSDS